MAAIDGSKFKAVNTRDRNFSRNSIKRRMDQVEASIERYMAALETADRQEGKLAKAKSERLKDKIASLKRQMAEFKALEVDVHAALDQQISLTDPDARSMATSGKGTGMVGYNVQTAVDTRHHLIVTHEVTNVGHDRDQLSTMAAEAKAVPWASRRSMCWPTAATSKGEEILAMRVSRALHRIVPKPLTSGAKAKGRCSANRTSVYSAQDDTYRCPAGEALTYRYTSDEAGKMMRAYWTTKCPDMPVASRVTAQPAQPRRIKRWEHEGVIDAMQERLDRKPDAMRIRRATVEHPFGTLKAWMGPPPG